MRLIDADGLKQSLDMCIYTTKLLRDGKADLISNHHISELESFKRIINLQTTIDAEPIRHGHWVPKTVMIKSITAKNYTCSVCGSESYNTNYCSNCGAKMDEE
jgi:hypothetical protein